MFKNLASLIFLGLVFSGNACGRVLTFATQEPIVVSKTVYPPALQSVGNQLEAASTTKATKGLKFVFVYETATVCDTDVSAVTSTITETEWVTATTTEFFQDGTMIQYSGNLEQQDYNVSPNSGSFGGAVGSSSGGSSGSSSGDSVGGSSGGSSGSYFGSSAGGSSGGSSGGSFGSSSRSSFEGSSGSSFGGSSGVSSGGGFGVFNEGYFQGSIDVSLGGSADAINLSKLIKALGSASTSTLLTDGPTTSVSYSTKYTGLGTTKENPVSRITAVSGSATISIGSWSFSNAKQANLSTTTSDARVSGSSMPSGAQGLTSKSTFTSGSEGATSPNSEVTSSSLDFLGSEQEMAQRNISSYDSSMGWNYSFPSQSASSSPSSSSVAISPSNSNIFVLAAETSCVFQKDLFGPISEKNPAEYYTAKDHPLAIPRGVSQGSPFGTNKFYSNLFLGNQDNTVFLSPYEVYWDKTRFQGLAVQYPNPKRINYGGSGANGAKGYYFNAVYVAGLYVGATTITPGNNYMRVFDQEALSVGVSLSASLGDETNYIEFPLVEGMGFVTSIYHGSMIPKLYGNGEISDIEQITYANVSRTIQYRVTIGLGETWLVFVTVPEEGKAFDLSLVDGTLVGSSAIDGLIIQFAITPSDESLEKVYFAAAGKYASGATVTGSIACEQAAHQISYQTTGSSFGCAPLIFALPHHFPILTNSVKSRFSGITVPSTTKGTMRGYLTNVLSFSDSVDTNVQWLPYIKGRNTELKYTKAQIELIRQAAVDELQGVDIKQTLWSQSSQYGMGKAIDKYAYMMYVLYTIVQDKTLAAEVEEALKAVFAEIKAGQGIAAAFYDTKFKGVTSEQAFTDPLANFGNGYYNDHHFHYGYFIHAAALIGLIDGKEGGSWAAENREFVNMWVRDVANPSRTDKHFPVFRSFDWYAGHSWAKGLFAFQDGKDEESTSEDVHFSYAMKMWGKVIGDQSMEARGDLMLSLQKRAFSSYFLYQDDNNIVSPEILRNKVSGIFFENKVDYTTWFGNKPEYIHGIQMLPMSAALGSVRSSVFAQQEWDQILSKVTADSTWQGLLNANRVLFDAPASWDFFAASDFNFRTHLDEGQSRAWALAYAAPFKNEADGLR